MNGVVEPLCIMGIMHAGWLRKSKSGGPSSPAAMMYKKRVCCLSFLLLVLRKQKLNEILRNFFH